MTRCEQETTNLGGRYYNEGKPTIADENAHCPLHSSHLVNSVLSAILIPGKQGNGVGSGESTVP